MVMMQGTWRINANGEQGLLVLQSTNNVSFNGTIKLDDTGGRTDPVDGRWDEPKRTITFNRHLPDGNTQIFTGLLGDNHPENTVLAGRLGTCCGWVMSPLKQGATYLISLDSFHCRQTRDTISLPEFTGRDVVYAALVTQTFSQVGYSEILAQPKTIGVVHHGEDHPIGIPFGVRLQPNESVTFSYLLVNSGFQGSGAQAVGRFLDEVSGAVRDALNVIYAAEKGIWEALNELTLGLNKLQFSGCDGIVAGDKITKTAAELNQLMPATGSRHVETRE